MAPSIALRSLRSSPSLLACSSRSIASVGARKFHSTPRRAEHYADADLSTFTKVISKRQSKGRIVLVDFYANWCGPCHQLSPILESLTSDPKAPTGSKRPLDLITVNTEDDDGQFLSAKHKVRALPTVIAFQDGEVVSQFVGALPEAAVRDFLKKL